MSTPASAYFMEVLMALVCRTSARTFLSFSFGRKLACRREGSATPVHFCWGTITLKTPEHPLPPHQARMHERVPVSKKTRPNLPRLPTVAGNISRHNYH